MKTDKALKSKITQLWNIISDHQTSVPNVGSNEFKAKAFAQLEYVLIEADLLAQRRERPSERAMRASMSSELINKRELTPHED